MKKLLIFFWGVIIFVLIPIGMYIDLVYSVEVKYHDTGLVFMIVVFLTSFMNIFTRHEEFFIGPQLSKMFLSIVVGILAFAQKYKFYGVIGPDNEIIKSGPEALYFSVVTWTTLGYGDFQPTPEARVFAAVEAVMGTLFIPLVIAAFLFYFTKKATNVKKS